MSPDWKRIREQFPALRRWVYLNSATYGQLPRCAAEAVAAHFRRRDELGCTDFLAWFDDADRLRNLCATLVHASPDDIAFFQNASSALSLFLGSIDWHPGDSIVTLENEFPNNIYHPALLRQSGIEFVETSWSGFAKAFEKPVRALLLSTVNYTTGFRAPLDVVFAKARAAGAMVYLDGTQGTGALDFDAGKWQPDMFVVDGYKWLLCPNGAGFAYIRPEFRRKAPPAVIGWRSHKGWRDVDRLHRGAPEFKDSAEKYEGGMLPFPVLYGMEASIKLILEIGIETIERRVLELAAQARHILAAHGAELLPGPCNSPVIAAHFPGLDASCLAKRLRDRRVVVSARHGFLRVSTHFYNNEEDLEAFATALRQCV